MADSSAADLQVTSLLTPEQIATYNQLRGYLGMGNIPTCIKPFREISVQGDGHWPLDFWLTELFLASDRHLALTAFNY